MESAGSPLESFPSDVALNPNSDHRLEPACPEPRCPAVDNSSVQSWEVCRSQRVWKGQTRVWQREGIVPLWSVLEQPLLGEVLGATIRESDKGRLWRW